MTGYELAKAGRAEILKLLAIVLLCGMTIGTCIGATLAWLGA